MPDMEKVIKGLEECLGTGKCTECIYKSPVMLCCKYLLEDALKLLKEQEAVEPRWFIDAHNPAGAFRCSACGERIIEKNIDFYCSKCGKPILWEGR